MSSPIFIPPMTSAGGSCDPVTYQNSDSSFSGSVPSGDNLAIPDVTVETGDGDLVFPGAVDIDLSAYFEMPPNPTGVYVPDVTPGPGILPWVSVSANCTAGNGFIQKNTGGGAYNTTGGFLIPTLGDFSVQYRANTNQGSRSGITFHPLFLSTVFIDQQIGWTKGNAVNWDVYLNGSPQGIGANVAMNAFVRIDRVGDQIRMYLDGAHLITYTLPPYSGYVYWVMNQYDDATYDVVNGSGRIYDITVTFP